MKALITFMALLIFNAPNCLAQVDKPGLLKNVNVKTGLTAFGFYNPTGEYTYILQENSKPKEINRNKWGASLSIVILFPLDTNNISNIILNISLITLQEYKAGLFNSQTPFGVGYAIFPKRSAIGFNAMVNFGKSKRMNEVARESQQFPLHLYPMCTVNAEIPEEVLQKYMYTYISVSYNLGIVVRL